MRRPKRGFTLLEMLITIAVLAVAALVMGRLSESTFKTLDQARSADRANAALDRALMLLRQDSWSARTLQTNADGSIAVGDSTWRSADGTLTRSQGTDGSLRIGMPVTLSIDGSEVVIQTAGRVVRMTGPMLKGDGQ